MIILSVCVRENTEGSKFQSMGKIVPPGGREMNYERHEGDKASPHTKPQRQNTHMLVIMSSNSCLAFHFEPETPSEA